MKGILRILFAISTIEVSRLTRSCAGSSRRQCDAFGSKEKTLHANMGEHTGVPQFEGDDANRFFARDLT